MFIKSIFSKIFLILGFVFFISCTPPTINSKDISKTDDATDFTDNHDSDDIDDITDISDNTDTDDIDLQKCAAEDKKSLHFMPQYDLHHKIFNGTDHPEICMINGQQKAIGAVMWIDEQTTQQQNICSATLVGDKYVLTAAHCVLRDQYLLIPFNPSELRFVLGKNAIQPDFEYEIETIHYNPNFDPELENTGYDNAILVLTSSPLDDDTNLYPIPYFKNGNLDFLRGNYVQQVGYGSTEEDYYNSIKHWTPELVSDVNYNNGEIEVNGQQISSVCSGDSGGPTLYPLNGNILTVLGTVSWGDPNCVGTDHYALTSFDSTFLSSHIPENENYCRNVALKGKCENNTAIWCENNRLKTECCKTNCTENQEGNFRCSTSRDTCSSSLNYEGKCENNTAIWCWGGKVQSRNCEFCGLECQNTENSLLGNYCQ